MDKVKDGDSDAEDEVVELKHIIATANSPAWYMNPQFQRGQKYIEAHIPYRYGREPKLVQEPEISGSRLLSKTGATSCSFPQTHGG
jgi:hypothetical protein